MLSLSSYHTAIIQTGAAMFSIAAPVGGYAIVPFVEGPAPLVAKPLLAMNDNVASQKTAGTSFKATGEIGLTRHLDHAHNEALFSALMSSSTEVSGPIYLD